MLIYSLYNYTQKKVKNMKSNSISKLSFYLEMLKARYGDGEYFKEINISFKSGTKAFPANVKKDGDELVLTFSGAKQPFVWNKIPEIAKDYDAMQLIYRERGTDAVINVDDRNVTLRYDDISSIEKNLTVAVMGCVVNGPGEAKDADLGIAGGNGYCLLFKKGEPYLKVRKDEAKAAFFKELERFLHEG